MSLLVCCHKLTSHLMFLINQTVSEKRKSVWRLPGEAKTKVDSNEN